MRFFLLLLALIPTILEAQNSSSAPRPAPRGIPRFSLDAGPVFSAGPARNGAYLGDAGRRAALLGEETGGFEAWVWPLKLVRDVRLAFKTADMSEPIDGARLARQVTARPEGATIVYSHPGFTVREHLFVPLNETGALILLDVHTLKPLDVQVRMQADFNLAWPGRFNGSTVIWLEDQKRFQLAQNSAQTYNGLVGSPAAVSGSTASSAMQLGLRIEPGSAAAEFTPIAIAGGAISIDSVAASYQRLLTNAQRYWREKVERYRHVRQDFVNIETPDTRIDNAFDWSKANLAQAIACNPDFGCGLVAGYGPAGLREYRPGLAWYFGSDAAIGALALATTGVFDAAREGLQFLARQQRTDGKIPSEISHAARTLPWLTHYPFAWSDAEATPWFLVASAAYWNNSSDREFLRQIWPSVLKAFRWSAATDTDNDGLMETPRAGAGALEVNELATDALSDMYLSGTWIAALEGMAALAGAFGASDVEREAEALHTRAARTLESAFWLTGGQYRAFALLQPRADPSRVSRPRTSDALSTWQAVALALGVDPLPNEHTLREAGSSALTVDWGVRTLSRYRGGYDPLEENNGAVSPSMTGFTALAHYRQHRSWAAYDLVRDVARATFDFGRGHTPSALSGAFYQLLGTATPQQTRASATLALATVRGLFGVEVDAVNNAVALEPHLPAEWNSASISNIRIGSNRLIVNIEREEQRVAVTLRRNGEGGAPLFVRVAPALPLGARVTRVQVDDRDAPVQTEDSRYDVHPVVEVTLADAATVDIEFTGGLEVVSPVERLEIGDAAEALRVLDLQRADRNYAILVEGLPGATYTLTLRSALRARNVTGAEVIEQAGERIQLRVRMPPSNGAFVRREIILRT